MYIELIPGLKKAVAEYLRDIRPGIEAAGLNDLFSRPTAIAWKVENLAEFNKAVEVATNLEAKLIHTGRVNGRYIAIIVLKEPLVLDVQIIKLMQKRPASNDVSGLDHMDFLVSSDEDAARIMSSQSKIEFEHQSNHRHDWLTTIINDREAKLVDHSVLEVTEVELAELREDLQV